MQNLGTECNLQKNVLQSPYRLHLPWDFCFEREQAREVGGGVMSLQGCVWHSRILISLVCIFMNIEN